MEEATIDRYPGISQSSDVRIKDSEDQLLVMLLIKKKSQGAETITQFFLFVLWILFDTPSSTTKLLCIKIYRQSCLSVTTNLQKSVVVIIEEISSRWFSYRYAFANKWHVIIFLKSFYFWKNHFLNNTYTDIWFWIFLLCEFNFQLATRSNIGFFLKIWINFNTLPIRKIKQTIVIHIIDNLLHNLSFL